MRTNASEETPLSLDLSPREDYSKCVQDYEVNSDKCQRRWTSFHDCDRSYKSLQLELYELLTHGDDTWEMIQATGKGTVAQKSAIDTLQSTVEKMYTNLTSQEDSIKHVEESMRKAVRQLERTSDNIEGLMQQVAAVRKNLADRVKHMTHLEPGLGKKKSPREKKRSISPKRDQRKSDKAGYTK
jgi:predicted  nucleic acid-binding Zn-ribbon protein